MPVFEVLEQQGLEVYLVNARHTKNMPGRKSDVQECQWLLQLHAFGLLNNSFQPTNEIRIARTLWRQRGGRGCQQHSTHAEGPDARDSIRIINRTELAIVVNRKPWCGSVPATVMAYSPGASPSGLPRYRRRRGNQSRCNCPRSAESHACSYQSVCKIPRCRRER